MAYRRVQFGGFGDGGTPPDVIVLLAVVFATFSMQFFEPINLIPALMRLTPLVWENGFLWQLVTYPFAGFGGPSIWILLELYILWWTGREMYHRLGQRRFWRLLAFAALSAALVAVAVQLLIVAFDGAGYNAFLIMQGQRMLIAILLAAFGTLMGEATVLLIIFPIQARFFLVLEIVFAFIAFLGNRDLAGFLGICTAVGFTYVYLTPGGIKRLFKDLRLRIRQKRLRNRLNRLQRERGIRVVDRDEDDRWVN